MVLIAHATLEKVMNSVRKQKKKKAVNYCFNDLDSADQLPFQKMKMNDTNLVLSRE